MGSTPSNRAKKKKKRRKKRHKGIPSLRGGENHPFRGKRGTGTRFDNCVRRMSHRKGVHNARKLCAAIGRAKYGRRLRG